MREKRERRRERERRERRGERHLNLVGINALKILNNNL